MSFKDILNAFVEIPEKKPAPSPASASVQATPVTSSYVPQAPAATPMVESIAMDSTLAPKFAEKIQAAYKNSPTYNQVLQFSEALESLREFIPEEGSRFRAALKQLHLLASDLATAYQSLIQIIDGEDAHFRDMIDQQRQAEIGTREQKVQAINQQIEAANNQIKSMMTDRDTTATEIVSLKTKYSTAENSFDGAAQSLTAGIKDTLSKLSIYGQITTTAPKA